jgi:hypothetical protein
MNLCNTNRLRITVSNARRFRLDRGLSHFRSDDHDRGTEHNWSLVLGPLWLFVKLRPHGKDDLHLYGKGTPKPISVLRASYERLFRSDSGT